MTRPRRQGRAATTDGRRPSTGRRGWPGAARLVGWALLPAAALLRALAFAFPEGTERLYGRIVYPPVAAVLGGLNGWLPASMLELLALAGLGAGAWWLARRIRSGRAAGEAAPRHDASAQEEKVEADEGATVASMLGGRLLRWLERAWIGAGLLLLAFLLSWGLNYARPSLAERLDIRPRPAEAGEVLELGRGLAEETARAWERLGADPESPTRLDLSIRELDRLVDARFRELDLPGLRLPGDPSPPKPLWVSPVLSRLGVSGVFIPFTGEPSINAQVPDASMPLVVAHEKAHQRGITDEGEANLVAWMVCVDAERPYLRYAARLYGASRLLAAAAADLPEEAGAAYGRMGPGPLTDLRTIREFWEAHRGAASRAATRINDAYLRSNRVPGGVHSYGRVVDLLVALERRRREGGLDPPTE